MSGLLRYALLLLFASTPLLLTPGCEIESETTTIMDPSEPVVEDVERP